MNDITIQQARVLLLAAQGLHTRRELPAAKEDVLAAIREMGVLQIDTINVVARSPYLVLWSRLGLYDPHWLDEFLDEGALFEYWSHAACLVPIEDFRLYRRDMLEGHPHARAWLQENGEQALAMLARVRETSEVRSVDFERTDGHIPGWWSWKPEKRLLEALFSTGEIMIARRDRTFQRVYSTRQLVLPGWEDAALPSAEESRRELALKSVRSLGVTKARWVPDYFKRRAQGIADLLATLAAEGLLLRVTVEGWEVPGYVHPDNQDLLNSVATGALQSELTTLLSPFDPVVWHRPRAADLFGFTYRIETYTPATKRRYGYFTLPILHRGALVGRLDPKAHRKDGRLQIRALHLEAGVPLTDDLIVGLRDTLRDFAAWQNLTTIEIDSSDPPALRPALQAALQ